MHLRGGTGHPTLPCMTSSRSEKTDLANSESGSMSHRGSAKAVCAVLRRDLARRKATAASIAFDMTLTIGGLRFVLLFFFLDFFLVPSIWASGREAHLGPDPCLDADVSGTTCRGIGRSSPPGDKSIPSRNARARGKHELDGCS